MRKVETTIEIETAPANIIRAFIEEEMLRGWWGVERSLIEKKIGGVYTLAWNVSSNGFGFVSSGSVKTYDPEKILELERVVYLNPERPILGPMMLTVQATPKGSNTELYLCQSGYQQGPDWDWYYDAVTQAWPVVATTLKDYLESKYKS